MLLKEFWKKEVVFCPESDYSAVMVKLKLNDKHKPYTKAIWSRDYTKFVQSNALADCMMVDWAEMFMQQTSLDDTNDALVNKLIEMHEVCCSKKKIVITEKKKVWFSCSFKSRKVPKESLSEKENKGWPR